MNGAHPARPRPNGSASRVQSIPRFPTMKTTTALLFGALLLGAAANAQSPTRQRFGTGELPEFLKPYDLDGDGKLSEEEHQAAMKALRESKPVRPGIKNPIDTDGDGKVSDAERKAARDAAAAKVAEERIKRFNELDADQSGELTAEELKAIPRVTDAIIAQMIARLDTDKNGTVSQDEFTTVLKPIEPPVPPFPLPNPLPKPPRGTKIFCPGAVKAFDADKDGLLSETELAALKAAVDTNADGIVSRDEWKAYVTANPSLFPQRPLPLPPTEGIMPPPPGDGTLPPPLPPTDGGQFGPNGR